MRVSSIIFSIYRKKKKIKKSANIITFLFLFLFSIAKSFAFLENYALHKKINNESIFENFYYLLKPIRKTSVVIHGEHLSSSRA